MSVAADVPDSELVARMAAGDREAFAELFCRHQATVYRFCRQMLGSEDAAEDVTQDVFIALTKHPGRFNPSLASLTTYLYGIARNLVFERQKRSRGRREVDIEAVEDPAELSVTWDPAAALTDSHMLRQLRLAIVELPLPYREVVVLCELNGLSYEEAAAIARCPVGTIRSRLSRARTMLIERCRAQLNRKEEPAEPRQSKGRQRWLIATKNGC